jgi:hypothetical protein
MTEPAQNAPDTLEADVDAAIALCDGDVRAALRASLVYINFLEHELETTRAWSRRVTLAARFHLFAPQVRNSTTGARFSAPQIPPKNLEPHFI